jgi:hypothetical protein
VFNNKKGQLGDTTIFIGVFLLIFWVAFPFAMKLLISDSYTELSSNDLNTPKNTNILSIFSSAGIFFKFLVLDIPNISPYLRIFVNILQLLSLIFIISAGVSVFKR